MILGFMTKFGKKQTFFKEQILDGTKIHTLRADPSKRWKPQKVIQMATGVRTKHYEHFNHNRADLSKCKAVEHIYLSNYNNDLRAYIFNPITNQNKKTLSKEEIDQLIKNDGFGNLEHGLDRQDFISWFFPVGQNYWFGKIIHWTDKKYGE